MRVLGLRRQRFGGTATHTSLLVDALDKLGVELVVDDADEYIPNETARKVEKLVTPRVRAAAQGFDLVHAFSYRAAWACSAAFGRERWVYSALDMPKSVHPLLIERLNDARGGFCASQAVMDVLSRAKAERLSLLRPGVPPDRRTLDREESRRMLGADPDVFLLVAAGRFCAEHSLQTLFHVVEALPHHVRLYVSGQGELEGELRSLAKERSTVKTEPFSHQAALAAADMVVVPSTVGGFSHTALEAMHQGTAVAVRRTGGLAEHVVDYTTGFTFDTDEELLDMLNHLCFKREQVHEVGRAAREKVRAEHDISRVAGDLQRAYSEALR